MSLNNNQVEAICHIQGPLMILAGAGSGKTRVITHKIAYLIQKHNVRPKNILGVTFTNKAANEMKERLVAMLGRKNIRGITLNTFHALCSKILRKECQVIDFQANFSIYGEGDRQSVLKQILVDLNQAPESSEVDKLGSYISKAKNQLLLPEHLEGNQALAGISELFAIVYKLYQKRLKTHQAMDFDDLILYTIYLLKSNKDVREKYLSKFQFLLVDEYQDTNYAQYELIKLLTHSQANITIVGDDDQSIYSWRGSESSNFTRFETEFSPVHTVTLDQNYRSTSNILKAAHAIIEKNENRKEKTLWSEMEAGEPLYYLECDDETDEADKIADLILTNKIRRREKYHDYAIIYRTNFQSRPFENALREKNIPYRVIGGLSFYDRKEIKDLAAYLRLINNINDEISLYRIINYPKRGIGDVTIDALRDFANNNELSLFQAMERVNQIETLDMKAKTRVIEFTDLIFQFREEFEQYPLSQTFSRLVENLDYESAIFKLCKDDNEWRKKIDNIKNFTQSIEKYQKKSDDTMEDDSKPTLKGFLNFAALLYDFPAKDKNEVLDDQVTLLTVHSAKGLEFPHVFLVGMEEGIMPHGNNENLDEERRLCYVAFTRAMQTLTLSSCTGRKKYGTLISQTPSQFLDDIPEDLIIYQSVEQEKEVTEEEAVDYFSSMKSVLAE